MSNMSVIRMQKNGNFTCVNNEHMFDLQLSGLAQSILTKILALKDTWEFTMQGLYSMCQEGQKAVQNAFNQLIKAGYVVRRQIKDEQTKQWGQMMYYFYESPSLNPNFAHPEEDHEQFLPDEGQAAEMAYLAAWQKPLSGNAQQLNTNISSTILSQSVGEGLTDKTESEKKKIFSKEELQKIESYLKEYSGYPDVRNKKFCGETIYRLMDMLRTGKASNKKIVNPTELLDKLKAIQEKDRSLIIFMSKLKKYCDQALTGLKNEKNRENFLKAVTANFVLEYDLKFECTEEPQEQANRLMPKQEKKIIFREVLHQMDAGNPYYDDEEIESEEDCAGLDEEDRRLKCCRIPYHFRQNEEVMVNALKYLFCHSNSINEEDKEFESKVIDCLAEAVCTGRISHKQFVNPDRLIDRLNEINCSKEDSLTDWIGAFKLHLENKRGEKRASGEKIRDHYHFLKTLAVNHLLKDYNAGYVPGNYYF